MSYLSRLTPAFSHAYILRVRTLFSPTETSFTTLCFSSCRNIFLFRYMPSQKEITIGYIETALQSLDQLDVKLVQTLLNSGMELDAEFQSSLRRLTTFVLEDARNLGHSINITLMLKALERLGAHAGNIAEYLIYLVDGVNKAPPTKSN